MVHRNQLPGALVLLDIAIIAIVPFLSLALRFDGLITQPYVGIVLDYLPVSVVVNVIALYVFGLYHRLWRYAGIHELVMISLAVTISSVLILLYTASFGVIGPRSIHILNWLLNIMFLGSCRLFARVVQFIEPVGGSQENRVLIVGAGDAGAIIARELQQRYKNSKSLAGFVDDDLHKQRQMIYGIKILGTRQDISSIVTKYQISEIIIAMPSVESAIIRETINICKNTGCSVKIVPGVYELIDGQISIQQLRDVEIEDLLGRDSVVLDVNEIAGYLRGKRVLVTGAGGSIGSELCRQIAPMKPKQMLLLGKGENSIYEIDREMRTNHPGLDIKPIIADIRDKNRIATIFGDYQPQIVFHAAAHKHVPLMEAQPIEAVHNNIIGTSVVAEAAVRAHSETFIMISTDKAVNPTSVMGATKRVAELVIQHMNTISDTRFSAVRFGNVLGSRGSVIPLFKKQIAAGGPVTITHPDMIRYFMTIPEACQLVLQAGALSKGGEVFVLDMGDPVKIVDMASDLIRLSGLRPYEDIELKFIGLRPGEKLFEELLTSEEGIEATMHKKIFVSKLTSIDLESLYQGLIRLQQLQQPDEIIEALRNLVPTFCPKQKEAGHTA